MTNANAHTAGVAGFRTLEWTDLPSAIIPVTQGGTGRNTLTTGHALIGNGNGAINTRAISHTATDNTLTFPHDRVPMTTDLVTQGELRNAGLDGRQIVSGLVGAGSLRQRMRLGTGEDALQVANGGTGVTQVTANHVLVGQGGTSTQLTERPIRNIATQQTSRIVANADIATSNRGNDLVNVRTLRNAGLSTEQIVHGTLPIARGGTGVSSEAALVAMVGRVLYPVGSIYMSTTNTNPSTWMGGTTWEHWGQGRVPVGVGTGIFAANNDGSMRIGGRVDAIIPNHTHFVSLIGGGHSHAINIVDGGGTAGDWASFNATRQRSDADSFGTSGNNARRLGTAFEDAFGVRSTHIHSGHTGNASNGEVATHANLQPFITCYMWRRTA